MKRRILDESAAPGELLSLSHDDLHHLQKVLRTAVNAELEVLDGRGHRYRGRYLGPQAPQVEVEEELGEALGVEALTVYLSLIKTTRMAWAVEKLAELGVARFCPVVSSRSTGSARLDRWRRSAREAVKQSGRSVPMQVAAPVELAELGSLPEGEVGLVLVPNGPRLDSAALAGVWVHLAVGPEGGFTDAEVAGLVTHGWYKLGLGPAILRAETAAITAAAVVTMAQRDGN